MTKSMLTPTPPANAPDAPRSRSLFTHLLIRVLVALLGVSLMLFVVVMPGFQRTATMLAAEQGKACPPARSALFMTTSTRTT